MGNIVSGRFDPGASGGGLTEADIVLQWALTGKWVADQLGIAVFLTRDDDRDEDPVAKRDDLAKANGCTHFLSLHCNSASAVARGVETFYRDAADKVLAQKAQDSLLKVFGPDVPNRGLKLEGQSQHSRLAGYGVWPTRGTNRVRIHIQRQGPSIANFPRYAHRLLARAFAKNLG